MNHSSERQSPFGSTALWCHCSRRCVFVNVPSFSVCAAAGRKKTSVGISGRRQLAGLDLGRVVPERRALDLDEVAHDEPVEVRQREPVQLRVRRADRRILAEEEEALDLAVEHVERGLVRGVVAR